MGDLWTCHLGTVAYADALALQNAVRDARHAEAVPGVLLLLEHEPVFTRGRRTAEGELAGEAALGAPVVEVDRGGRATWHGPGQLVGYPIVLAQDVVGHVRALEGALVAALAEEGIAARSRVDDGPDFTGVWVGPRKIASLGVHVRRGVTTHGFALNVDNDLDAFDRMIACGLPDVRMTSVAQELGRAGPHLPCVRRRVAFAVAQALGARQRLVSAARLRASLDVPSTV